MSLLETKWKPSSYRERKENQKSFALLWPAKTSATFCYSLVITEKQFSLKLATKVILKKNHDVKGTMRNQLRNSMSFRLTVEEGWHWEVCWALGQFQSIFPLDDKHRHRGLCQESITVTMIPTESSFLCYPAGATEQPCNNEQWWHLQKNSMSNFKPPERLLFILLLWKKAILWMLCSFLEQPRWIWALLFYSKSLKMKDAIIERTSHQQQKHDRPGFQNELVMAEFSNQGPST